MTPTVVRRVVSLGKDRARRRPGRCRRGMFSPIVSSNACHIDYLSHTLTQSRPTIGKRKVYWLRRIRPRRPESE